MKAKIIRISNSKGIRIPKPLLDESGISDDAVNISVKGRSIVITPIDRKKVVFNEEYLLSLPALAKDWDRPEEDEAWASLQ